jgi:hypothetical protein
MAQIIGQSSATFSNAGGAVKDLFGGIGDLQSGDLKAEALDLKAKGDLAEAGQYDLAGSLALKNEAYTKTSTAIQQMQQDRNTTLQIGGQQNALAGSGFANSGSGLDILADSASQGALAHAVLGQQGLITEAGYDEQSQSYKLMSDTAKQTAASEEDMANQTKDASETAAIGDFAGSLMKGAAAVATLTVAPELAPVTMGIDGLGAIH